MIPPDMQIKVENAFLLYLLQVLHGCWGFREKNHFYPTKTSHNTNPAIVSITPLSGPSIANVFAKLMLETQTPPRPLIWYKPYVQRGTSLA